MRRALVLLLLLTLPVAARTRSVRTPNHDRILVIVAHPDDESLFSPLLGKRCVEERASCTILVMSKGENSACKLPGGCGDLGEKRASELLVAAALLHANSIQWSFPDVFTPESWPSNAAEEISKVIVSIRPDVIYTFDPNHGSSCHQAHRFTGSLALSVAGTIPVQVLETEIIRSPGVSFAAATDSAIAFDARRWWDYFVQELEAHESQFTPAEVDEIRFMPEEMRRVWLMDARALGTVQYRMRCD